MRFQDILGHGKEIGLLKRAVRDKRAAHAYLFAGPDGVGKSLVAEAFAAALNCEDFEEDACGRCPSCRAMEAAAHPNLLRVGPEKGVLRIDSVRELQRALNYKVESGFRVAVVDGADLMVRAASSVFLKTLEEPPSGSIIVLLSSRPDNLLPTILSRCQRINFGPLGEDVVAGVIEERCGLGEEEARTVARLSGGSLSRALKAVDKGILEKRDDLLKRLRAAGRGDAAGLLDLAEALSKDEDLDEMLEILKVWYRDLVVRVAGCPELVIDRDTEDITECLGGCSIDRSIDLFGLVEETRRNVLPPRNANKRLALEALLAGLSGGRPSRVSP